MAVIACGEVRTEAAAFPPFAELALAETRTLAQVAELAVVDSAPAMAVTTAITAARRRRFLGNGLINLSLSASAAAVGFLWIEDLRKLTTPT
jgi:hypothetical protein